MTGSDSQEGRSFWTPEPALGDLLFGNLLLKPVTNLPLNVKFMLVGFGGHFRDLSWIFRFGVQN